MFFSKMIGTGSYGHVFYPCLPYLDISATDVDIQTLDNMNNKYKVSKLIETYYAEKEMSRYEIIHKVDPTCDFHLGTMFMATPSRQNIPLISQCSDGKHIVSNFQDYQFIVMKYGGVTLRDYGSTIYNDAKRFIKNANTPDVLACWKDTLRLIHGIECMIRYNIIHNDIKTNNIVYDLKESRLNFIDFGMVQYMKNVYKKSLKNDYEYDIFYYSMPPETYFYNQKRFDIWRKLSLNERECWFQYACTSWNVGNHEKSWDTFLETYISKDTVAELPRSENECGIRSVVEDNHRSTEEYESSKKTLGLDGYDLLPNPCDNDFEDYSKSYMDILQEITKEMKHMDSFAKHISIFSVDASTTLTECFVEQSVENFRSFLLKDIDNYQDFKEFMQDSLYTIDMYGLGQSLMYMLIHTRSNLPIRFITNIYKLLQKMMNHNLTERIAMKDLVKEYTLVLQDIM